MHQWPRTIPSIWLKRNFFRAHVLEGASRKGDKNMKIEDKQNEDEKGLVIIGTQQEKD